MTSITIQRPRIALLPVLGMALTVAVLSLIPASTAQAAFRCGAAATTQYYGTKSVTSCADHSWSSFAGEARFQTWGGPFNGRWVDVRVWSQSQQRFVYQRSGIRVPDWQPSGTIRYNLYLGVNWQQNFSADARVCYDLSNDSNGILCTPWSVSGYVGPY